MVTMVTVVITVTMVSMVIMVTMVTVIITVVLTDISQAPQEAAIKDRGPSPQRNNAEGQGGASLFKGV